MIRSIVAGTILSHALTHSTLFLSYEAMKVSVMNAFQVEGEGEEVSVREVWCFYGSDRNMAAL